MFFKTQKPYINRVSAASKDAGNSLGPFAEQQSAGKDYLNKFLSDLRDTNPVNPNTAYGSFKEDLDLIKDPNSGQIVPNTGKDPFAISGQDYLANFIANYDRSAVLDPEERVSAGGLTALIQQKAEKGKEFPGSEGTSVS